MSAIDSGKNDSEEGKEEARRFAKIARLTEELASTIVYRGSADFDAFAKAKRISKELDLFFEAFTQKKLNDIKLEINKVATEFSARDDGKILNANGVNLYGYSRMSSSNNLYENLYILGAHLSVTSNECFYTIPESLQNS